MTALLFALRPWVRPPVLHGSRAVGVGFRTGARFLPIALLAITAACDSRPAHGLLGPVPELFTRIEVVEEHESCPAGATVVESGFDGDEDGELGDDEVSTTEVLCTGAPPPPGSSGRDLRGGTSLRVTARRSAKQAEQVRAQHTRSGRKRSHHTNDDNKDRWDRALARIRLVGQSHTRDRLAPGCVRHPQPRGRPGQDSGILV